MSYEIHFWTKDGVEFDEPDGSATVSGKIKIPIFSRADDFQKFMNSVVINKMDELEEIPVCGYLRVWEHGAGHKTVRIMKPLVLVSGSWGSRYKLCYSEDQLIKIVGSLYPKVEEPLKIRIAEDKKMDISRATHGPTEPKLESLEAATMAVLCESPTTDAVRKGHFVPFSSPELDKANEAFKLAKDAFNNLEKSKEILSSLERPNFKYGNDIRYAIELMDYMLHSSSEHISIFKKVLRKISVVVSIFGRHGEFVD